MFFPAIKFTDMKTINGIILVFILQMTASLPSYSQQIVRTAMVCSGGYSNLLDYTIGETFTTTMINGDYMLTLGMQQMDHLLIGTINEEISHDALSAIVYPNPTSGEFILKINSKKKSATTIKMYNSLGKQVFVKNTIVDMGTSEITINPGMLSSGIYFLSIISGNKYSQLRMQVN